MRRLDSSTARLIAARALWRADPASSGTLRAGPAGAFGPRTYPQDPGELRPSPRPFRVLGARRRLPYRRSRGAGSRLRPAGARAHRPRRDERRRGALQGLQEARDQPGSGARALVRGPPPHRGPQVRAQPPDAPRRLRQRVPQPGQAELRRLPGGLPPRQGQRGPRAAVEALRGRHRAHRLPPVALLPPARGGQPGRGPGPRRPAAPGLRARQRLLRGPAQRDRRAGQGERGDRADRARARPPAGRHRGRPLPPPGGLREPPRAALRADEEHDPGAEAQLRHQRVLPEELRRDGRGLRGLAGGARRHGRDSRALPGRDRARQDAHPALPDPGRRAGARLPAPPGPRGPPRPLRRPAPCGGGRAARDGARRDREDGLLVLLPDRLGLRQVRKGQRDRGRAGARLGRRIARVVLPRHHGGRPARLRTAVRALPEPGARLDAGHRHRLLGEGPGTGDALRRGQVRQGVRGADHHVRQNAAAERHARRGARPGSRLRRRRPPRKADPRAGHGPVALVRPVPGAGAGPAPRLRHRARLPRDHRHRARPRGHRPQRRHPRDRGVAGTNGERAYKIVTQYSMKPIAEIGLLKMDFLGLRNLDVIEDCLAIVEGSTGERPDMASLPLDDARTYEMMARGDSIGVFQFESEGMREALRKVKPTEFEDLVALNALYRPGAMRHIDTYARNKRNPDGVSYIDDRLRPITEATYGVILYQEQSMQIAKSVAGFSGAEAEDLRKAISKKNREAMAALRERFFDGARATGTAEGVINELWAVNEAAADYSFPRAHAACYGLISYRTAWLKANYPAEYMAALISSVMSTKDKVPFFVAQCEDMGIEVLPPDVNLSGHD